MAASSLLLFGPLSPQPNQAYLSDLQRCILDDLDLEFLNGVISELPSLWLALQKEFPELSIITGAEQLEQLKRLLSPMQLPDVWASSNLVLAPLTVISHIADFLRLRRTARNTIFPGIDNVQGFCVGFLVAAALASSWDEIEFRRSASTAIRLAVCVGAIIDLNDRSFRNPADRSSAIVVRWKTESGKQAFEGTLKDYPSAYISCFTDMNTVTVTASARDGTSMALNLLECGLSVQHIGLRGQYHHPANTKAMQQMKDFCNRDKCLQFPTADRLVLPLRSSFDANLITHGNLHDIALEVILTEQSHWYQTVKASLAVMDSQSIDIKCMGAEPVLPHSLTSELKHWPIPSKSSNAKVTGSPGLQNDIARDSDLPDFSSYPTPRTPSRLSAADAAVSTSAVAVIGMACRFPKADSLDEYWRLIRSGSNAVQHIPQTRFDPAQLWRDPKGPFWGNFLNDPDAFDHRFFSISGREAKSMDPQQRLLLQVVYEAMESSGYFGPRQNRPSGGVGCYIGVGSVDYEDNVASENTTAFSALGTLRAFISGRVSHYFGWTGPSITYDTACSSAAVAIHSACKAIQAGECSMAVAGGVNVMTSPKLFQNLAAGGFLSSSGASKAFDAHADGYCRGEGAGIVVLKPLAQATADGDFILSVIAGSAVNQGLNCTPITAPVSESQSSLYRHALAIAGIEPSEVSYVEAHGTGTPVGDPIECESIRQTFAGAQRTNNLFLGSVKDNIGHAEAASGVAALIKTILMMQNRTIPKQANFASLNPSIPPLEQDHMVIAERTQTWLAARRTAIINNYGAAGSNAAIVLQEFFPTQVEVVTSEANSNPTEEYEVPLFVSARSPENLRTYCMALKSFMETHSDATELNMLADVAYNLSIKQNRSLEYSWTFTSQNIRNFSNQLEASVTETLSFDRSIGAKRPVVLCFGGQTGRFVSLSRELYNNCRILQLHLVECDSACKTLGLPSIFPGIFQSEAVQDIVELHCRLFCLQYSCARCWLDCGLEVDTLIGHSFGQLTALSVAGSLSLLDGIRLISARARLIQQRWGPETGIMLAIEGDGPEVETLLDSVRQQHVNCSAEIACYNGPKNTVIAGDRESIEAVETVLTSEKYGKPLKAQRLNNTHAFHSRLVESILPGLEEITESIQFREAAIRVETCSPSRTWSNVDAVRVVQHSRMPVFFTNAVERTAKRLGPSIWVEAGSGSPIIAIIRRNLQTASSVGHVFQPIEIMNSKPQGNLARAFATLWAAGSTAQFWPFHQVQKDRYAWVNLPPYQFEKTRHWIDYKVPTGIKQEMTDASPPQTTELMHKLSGDSAQALFSINPTHDVFDLCTKGHSVLHHNLCPASMYSELAIRAARLLGEPTSSSRLPRIQQLEISSPLSLGPAGTIFLQLAKDTNCDEEWEFSLFSRTQSDIAGPTTHATGFVSLLAGGTAETSSLFQSLNRLVGNPRCEPIMNAATADGLNGAVVYKNFSRVVDYATYFRGVKRVFAKDHEAVGHVYVPENQPAELDPGCCDPVAIDNFLQVSGIHVNCLWNCQDDQVFVCTAIRELSFSEQFINKPPEKRAWTVYSNFEPDSSSQVANDIFVLESDSGQLVVTLMGAKFTKVPLKSLSRTLSKLNDGSQYGTFDNAKTQAAESPAVKEDYEHPNEARTPIGRNHFSLDDLPQVVEPHLDEVLKKLQVMLNELLEISIEDIKPDSALDDLGIDSLMVTEVIGEIKSRFGIAISNADFRDLTDLDSLSRRLQPTTPTQRSDQIRRSRVDQSPSHNDIPNRVHTASTQDPVGYNNQLSQDLAFTGPDCFARTKWAFDAAAHETTFIGFSKHVHPIQAQLVLAYVLETFRDLGCQLASLGPAQRLPDIHYSSKHQKVVGQLYKVLEDANIITRSSQGFYRTSVPVPQVSVDILHASIIEKFPQHASEHRLLHTTGSRLAECLTERADPIALLFGNPTARALMTDVYTNAPMFKAGTILLGRYLADILDRSESDREIQILELGAGTGGTTSILIELLANHTQKFRYTFTDLSSSLVVAAKKKFGQHGFMVYETLDIEQTPVSQHLSRYDIIISTNCIHATKNLRESTTNVRKMLCPNGILCLVELTQNLFWFDLVFGLLEGWWLFNDGRKHVLANERLWEQSLRQAGFHWVDWTEGNSEESQILRMITASPSKGLTPSRQDTFERGSINRLETQETVVFAQEGETQLFADINYPKAPDRENVTRPIALMIHGGGHVMLSRKDVRPLQTQILLEAGYLPVSIDYRLCPETTLVQGPMHDVRSALHWARHTLPTTRLQRADVVPNGDRVVAVGWSTGGHLAMTLAWTAPAVGLAPPDAILAFYCPTDYEDPFWEHPNVPRGAECETSHLAHDVWEGMYGSPITSYNPPTSAHALGGWMTPEDARSRICLIMNWKGQTLPMLINNLKHAKEDPRSRNLAPPTKKQIQSISPLAQIQSRAYRTPTFIVHGTRDDLIPWQQALRTYKALCDYGVLAEIRLVQGAVHLFDASKSFERDEQASRAVREGYRFLENFR